MLAMTPPAERIVVIVLDTEPTRNDGQTSNVSVLPVLEIVASAAPDELIEFEMLVFTEQWSKGLVLVGQLRHNPFLRIRRVVCTWSPTEDESRLAPIIAELIEQQKREVSRA